MMVSGRNKRGFGVSAVAAALLIGGAAAGRAQTAQTFHACYVPDVGALYVIQLDGLPDDCVAEDHVEITWTEGGTEVADGVVTTAKLANAAVTAAKLASGSVGTGKLADGAVTAAKLGEDVSIGVSDHGELGGLGKDDHPQYLLADGTRAASNGFAVTGTPPSGGIPIEGKGARLMWYPGKAAFRAGEVAGDEWDDASIGRYSAAMGLNTTASGRTSAAMGFQTRASGRSSAAMGSQTTASGRYSAAMGSQTTASGLHSVAMGSSTAASGRESTAIGLQTTASGIQSTAMGLSTIASGRRSTAMGLGTTAQAYASLAIGRYNTPFGFENEWNPGDVLFVAGNGSSSTNTSDALVLLKNGNLSIAGSLTQSSDIRDKEDINPVGGVLGRVLALKPIRYRFREGTGHPAEPRLGLSAQQVEPLFPELVREDHSGRLSVAYADLSAVLVRAIQEQQSQIEALRAEIDRLRREGR